MIAESDAEACLMKEDRREKIDDYLTPENHTASTNCLCFITFRLPNSTVTAQGSGTYQKKGDKEFIITSATNVVGGKDANG